MGALSEDSELLGTAACVHDTVRFTPALCFADVKALASPEGFCCHLTRAARPVGMLLLLRLPLAGEGKQAVQSMAQGHAAAEKVEQAAGSSSSSTTTTRPLVCSGSLDATLQPIFN